MILHSKSIIVVWNLLGMTTYVLLTLHYNKADFEGMRNILLDHNFMDFYDLNNLLIYLKFKLFIDMCLELESAVRAHKSDLHLILSKKASLPSKEKLHKSYKPIRLKLLNLQTKIVEARWNWEVKLIDFTHSRIKKSIKDIWIDFPPRQKLLKQGKTGKWN